MDAQKYVNYSSTVMGSPSQHRSDRLDCEYSPGRQLSETCRKLDSTEIEKLLSSGQNFSLYNSVHALDNSNVHNGNVYNIFIPPDPHPCRMPRRTLTVPINSETTSHSRQHTPYSWHVENERLNGSGSSASDFKEVGILIQILILILIFAISFIIFTSGAYLAGSERIRVPPTTVHPPQLIHACFIEANTDGNHATFLIVPVDTIEGSRIACCKHAKLASISSEDSGAEFTCSICTDSTICMQHIVHCTALEQDSAHVSNNGPAEFQHPINSPTVLEPPAHKNANRLLEPAQMLDTGSTTIPNLRTKFPLLTTILLVVLGLVAIVITICISVKALPRDCPLKMHQAFRTPVDEPYSLSHGYLGAHSILTLMCPNLSKRSTMLILRKNARSRTWV